MQKEWTFHWLLNFGMMASVRAKDLSGESELEENKAILLLDIDFRIPVESYTSLHYIYSIYLNLSRSNIAKCKDT